MYIYIYVYIYIYICIYIYMYVYLSESCTTAGFTKRSDRTKGLTWKSDVDHVTVAQHAHSMANSPAARA